MPVTCCMPHLFGSHFGQNGSTLKMGAPPSSTACAGLACECSPRLERTTTRDTSPNTLAALRIAATLQTRARVDESARMNKAEIHDARNRPRGRIADVKAGLQPRLTCLA